MPEDIEGAPLVELVPQARHEGLPRLGAMILLESVPGLGIALLHPSQEVRREEGPGPVVGRRVAFGMEPAMLRQVEADLDLEVDLLVQVHADCFPPRERTSIWPVTAAEIRAVRRSCRRSMARCASRIKLSILQVSPSRCAAI